MNTQACHSQKNKEEPQTCDQGKHSRKDQERVSSRFYFSPPTHFFSFLKMGLEAVRIQNYDNWMPVDDFPMTAFLNF